MASWITTAGWAGAAQRRWGQARIVTPDGIFTPDEALAQASRSVSATDSTRSRWSWAPRTLLTAAKDLRDLTRAIRFTRSVARTVGNSNEFAFVWQRHVPFHRAGFELAKSAGCPLVLSVHGLDFQEARQWGISRPGWGWLIETLGERRLLRQADLVTCVSEELATVVRGQGVSPERILVTPNGVDVERFSPRTPDSSRRRELGLREEAFVLGWVGSFRVFHGLDQLFDAMERLQHRQVEVDLLLVGLGPGVHRARDDVQRRGLRNVVFAGSFPHDQMPEVMSLMDAAVVLGSADEKFHYSPVKVREYMAMGLPVVAARLGELERLLEDEGDAILVEPSRAEDLTEAIVRLVREPALRERLGERARRHVAESGSWDAVLADMTERLGLRV